MSTLDIATRIAGVAAGHDELRSKLHAARVYLGAGRIERFLDRVEETGAELWERFKRFRKGGRNRSFEHFVISVVEEEKVFT